MEYSIEPIRKEGGGPEGCGAGDKASVTLVCHPPKEAPNEGTYLIAKSMTEVGQ